MLKIVFVRAHRADCDRLRRRASCANRTPGKRDGIARRRAVVRGRPMSSAPACRASCENGVACRASIVARIDMYRHIPARMRDARIEHSHYMSRFTRGFADAHDCRSSVPHHRFATFGDCFAALAGVLPFDAMLSRCARPQRGVARRRFHRDQPARCDTFAHRIEFASNLIGQVKARDSNGASHFSAMHLTEIQEIPDDRAIYLMFRAKFESARKTCGACQRGVHSLRYRTGARVFTLTKSLHFVGCAS
ncbi:hypothetical protein [Burkholderia sp. BDU5]|uniref:hypothetical protein n=1 Tax=Burkholderia sp. BDU5 TaxID=1385590 RepID=UPI0018D2336B|nr:hypothetical protein [Burkholderia sp. BDU5]